MRANDDERDVFNFPLAVSLDGEELWLMVQAENFNGGRFYVVRGNGIEPLHILGVFEEGEEKEKLHLTVMNEDTSREALVAAVVHILQQPPDNDDLPDKA